MAAFIKGFFPAGFLAGALAGIVATRRIGTSPIQKAAVYSGCNARNMIQPTRKAEILSILYPQ